jgi:glycosyltransferase involved in cell wall biosynthesis
MPKPLRALFLCPYPLDRAPGQRYRFEQWLDLLPAGAVASELQPLFDRAAYDVLYEPGATPRKVAAVLAGLTRRIGSIARSRRYDVVYVYREAFPFGPPLIEQFLERRIPVVFDFDDAVYLGDTSAANRFLRNLKRPSKVAEIVSLATRTIVGNEALSSWATQHSDRVTIVPSTVDTVRYQPRRRDPHDLVRVGWSGSPTTAAHLHTIDGALRRVLRELPAELHVIGAPDYHLSGADRVTVKPWDPASEVDDLASFDIGLMPLPDDEWSRGKGGMKALLYLSVGVPAVVSPVGINTDIVEDGRNGRLASSEGEWVDAVAALVRDAELRKRLGSAGRRTVVERFSGQQWAPVFLEVLEQAAGSRV